MPALKELYLRFGKEQMVYLQKVRGFWVAAPDSDNLCKD
jgi:hypothetical protein